MNLGAIPWADGPQRVSPWDDGDDPVATWETPALCPSWSKALDARRDAFVARLRSVAWHRFRTAYGNGVSVPVALLEIAYGPLERAPEHAFDLRQSLCHQNAHLSSAALPAYPFLACLAYHALDEYRPDDRWDNLLAELTKIIYGLSFVRLDELSIDAAAFHQALRERMQTDASDFERLTGSFAPWIASSLKGMLPPAPRSKVGLALATLGQTPIHGLRLNPTTGTNGWYLWCGGEMGTDDDFFAPLHVEHLAERLPAVVPYLDLPPGYRFVIDGDGYEDIWFDAALLTG